MNAATESAAPELKSPWWILVFGCVLAVTILGSGWSYFTNRRTEARRTFEETLASIADLKSEQIAGWVKERKGDARLILENPLLRLFLLQPDDGVARSDLLGWMTVLRQSYDYRAVVVFDAAGQIVLASFGDGDPVLECLSGRVASVLSAQDVVFNDLHRAGPEDPIHISLEVPILSKSGRGQRAVGVLVLVVDPYQFLYPLVQNWPTRSPSAETLLIRREGDTVLFLNELRHRTNTALAMRLPVDRVDLPAAFAVGGGEGVVEGIDYRDVAVLATTRSVPGTPWFMVSKVDQEEIRAPILARAWTVAGTTMSLLVASGMGLGMLWRQNTMTFTRRELHQRRISEGKMRQLNAELERRVVVRTKRLQEVNQELEAFSYSVSHDLRAPLRAIDGFGQILVEDYSERLDEEGRRCLRTIQEEARRMGSLIDDLLQFSRLGRQEMGGVSVDMRALARSVFEELRRGCDDRPLEFLLGELPAAAGDPAMLRQVLVNLIGNAIKYSAKQEKSVIEVGGVGGDDENMWFVRDNGVGFDARYTDKLFGVFQRLHTADEFAGTGVGLALVKRIVLRHGGRVWAEGALEKGATFHFALPTAPVNDPDEQLPPAEGSAFHPSGST